MSGRNRSCDRGASFIEYGGIVLLLGTVVTVVVAFGMPDKVTTFYSVGLCRIAGVETEECAGEGEGGDTPRTDAAEPQAPVHEIPAPDSEERRPDDDSTWPYAVTPASYPPDPGEGGDEDEESSAEDPVTSGDVPESESPVYAEEHSYPQQSEVIASQNDYNTVEGAELSQCTVSPSIIGSPPPRNPLTGSTTCDVLDEIDTVVLGARHLACWNPMYWGKDEDWAYCRPHSADMLEHFAEGSGDPVDLDMESFMEEIPEFEDEVERAQQDVIDEVLADAEARGIDGPTTFPIRTSQTGWGYPPDDVNGRDYVYDNPDWATALGSFHYWLEGEITVHPPEEPGGDYTYSMDSSVNMQKWYDWERETTEPLFGGEGWKSNISQINHSDLAFLHQTGIAREFWVRGDTDLPTVEG